MNKKLVDLYHHHDFQKHMKDRKRTCNEHYQRQVRERTESGSYINKRIDALIHRMVDFALFIYEVLVVYTNKHIKY